MLDAIELFQGLNPRELEQISNITVTETVKRGEVIFRQGEYSREFYLIKAGQVEISIKDFLNEKKILALLKSGDFFGEMALFDKDSARSATAIAAQNSVLFKIPGQDFERLLNDRPAISFKLLSALSKRLKESNLQKIAKPAGEPVYDAKVITVGSARAGYGKTTFATAMAQLMANELPKQILFIDLDLYYGDGTYVLGVFSPKSIVQLAERLRTGVSKREDLLGNLVRHSENLYSLPAPKDFLDSDRVTGEELIPVIKTCRRHFDYIIIDTDSTMGEIFFNALDLADHIFFLVSLNDAIAIKSNSLFFQGLSHLSLPENHVKLLIVKTNDPQALGKAQKMFKFPVLGALPSVKEFRLEHGETVYKHVPNDPYCEVLRTIGREIFGETSFHRKAESGFIYRLLFAPGGHHGAGTQGSQPGGETGVPTDDPLNMAAENYASVLKYIRLNISSGYLDQALKDATRMIEICPESPQLFQMLGEIYYLQKNFSQALEAFHRALHFDPANHLALAFLSLIEGRPEHLDQAIKLLQARLEKSPDFPDLLTDMAKVLFLHQSFPEAETFCRRALEISPGYAEANVQLALCLAEMQKFDDAIHVLLQVKPKNVRIYYLLGQYFFNSGRFYQASQAFHFVSEINPTYQDIGEKLEHLRVYFQKLHSLLEIHKDLRTSFPNYPDIRSRIGNILQLIGKREEAIAEYEEALRLNPGYVEAKKKLEWLQQTHDFQVDFTNAADHLVSLGITPETPDFRLEILFEKLASGRSEKSSGEEFVFTVRNLQDGRSIQLPLTLDTLRAGRLLADCSSLEPLFPEDMLLVQISIKESHEVLATMPHVVAIKELKTGSATIDLSTPESRAWYYPFHADSPFRPPLRHFFVSLQCPEMARAIAGDSPAYRVELRNHNTNTVAQGRTHAEDPARVGFIFNSTSRRDIMREGDQLRLKVFDRNSAEVLSMDFPVLKEDIDEFSKSIVLESLGYYFSAMEPPAEKAREAGG
ncbi:MAG: tetratricopeptide repeat protein [Candidatus Riflebacteria bacterium]|nr:tetratricopeptide repeat protein [Candidatus Riflebacteria bacterium]